MPDRIVGEIPKSARESIRVSLREKGGTLGCDLRMATTIGHGPMRETPKGIRIPLARLADVIEALQEVQRLAGSIDQ
ncbi:MULTISPECIES: hypothetical protein [unclassified Methylobacterium]|uniref:hypothetical protein n=1 Tax=unclassified Methylobacterium TaxID=2615210 RepID=UPI0011C1FD70|nr:MULTISPECIES: hypothetical protein [unclassified Methylobacterium]QEE41568.1 hypothetical protein FVA80_24100 [Methylobacterium sp. WL1]TXN57054.1 hypothetical protein FV241_12585 [Methylobacterium sp. WL2]